MMRAILLLVILGSLLGNVTAYAEVEDKQKSPEELHMDVGYKTMDEALDDVEEHFNRKLNLPVRVPAIPFTHYYARLNDVDGDINDSFEVKFIHESKPENHYKIDVRPIERKIPIREQDVLKVFPLNNGKEAKWMKQEAFHILFFETERWQYILSVDRRVEDKVSAEELVRIANSID